MSFVVWQWIYKIGSPAVAYRWAVRFQPWLMAFCFVFLAYGLIGGLWLAPSDYQQGDAYRIIYLHVPAAILSLLIYLVMTVAVGIHFIWKIKVADSVAKASAPLGASFTLLALISGAIWGKPTWGTWWIWDARLTSELILLFIYVGIMGLRSAVPERTLAAKASGLMTLIGCVNIPIVHYSVDWWSTLHQGATIRFFSQSTIAPSMLHPLLAMIAAFILFYGWVLSLRVRADILCQEQETQWVRKLSMKSD